MGQLYRLDFENGKSYIGISFKSAEHRYKVHAKAEKNGRAYLIYHAWRKHGAPKLVVLATVEDYDLAETEKRAIAAYNTKAPNGYNLTDGGSEGTRGLKHSEESKAKMSASKLGRNPWNKGKSGLYSAETIAKIADGARGRTHNRGKVRSDELKKRIALTNTGKKASDETKAKMAESQRLRQAGNLKFEIICKTCGKSVFVIPSRKDRTKYCSKECCKY